MDPSALEPVNKWMGLGPSGIHGRGAYALRAIPADMLVIVYEGERITKEEAARRCLAENPYIFTIDDEYDLDGDVPWNPARFLNHSCAPNCEAQQDGDRINIVALRPIEAGEELTFNYGYELDEFWREYPCRCGAPNCLGYILATEFWPAARAALEQPAA